ncbi:MAG: HDOD domain-containing protein [bacterium]|nr:HDOD domain-containing protein [bacterium]
MDSRDDKQQISGSVLFFNVDPTIVLPLIGDLSDFGVESFQLGDRGEALRAVRAEKIDMVFIDFKPGEPGSIEFLKLLRKKFPTVNRVCFSEPDHKSLVIQQVLKGLVTSYFEKTAAPKSIVNGILHILFARNTLKSEKLLKLLDSTEALPAFPRVYHEFMEAIEDDRPTKEIARIIEKDVSIATRVLRIANSDFYRTGKIGSIERAGIYLGLDTIKNIVFTVSLSSLKRLTETQRKHLEKIIYHSVQVNQNFQKVYTQQTGEKIADQYATIGITHDIGKIIMMQNLPARFNKIIRYQEKNPDIGFYRSEVELGFEGQTHAEIGAYFLNLWNFPESSVFTALFHHSTEEFSEPYKEILDIFAIVNDVAQSEV